MNHKEDDSLMTRMGNEINDQIQKQFYTTLVADQESTPMTLEKLQATLNNAKREMNHIYIISEKNIPDDCYGILYVRPEDAAKWKVSK